MSRVLLTHNYHLALDPAEAAVSRPYPPLQALVAASRLRQAGHSVVFDDRLFKPDSSDFGSVVDAAIPDVVAIVGDDHSVAMKQCLGGARRAGEDLLRAAASRGLPTLISGPDVSDQPQHYLSAGASAAVCGEVQDVLLAWVDGENSLAGVHGLRGAGGRAAALTDVDALPAPAWDLVDLEAYRRAWRGQGGWELALSTARGCPFRCNWCAKPTWGRSYAVRSPQRVAQDVVALQHQQRPDRLWFIDDIFALKATWLADYRQALDTLLGDAPRLPYRCLSRADLLVASGVCADLAATGCRQVWMGAESGSDKILRAMDKDCTVAQLGQATALLRQQGIQVGFFLQLGYPGETLQDVRATIDMVARLRPDEIGVSVTYPLPGTVFADRVAGARTGPGWESSMDNQPLFQAPFDRAFYSAAKRSIQHQHRVALARRALSELALRRDRQSLRRVLTTGLHGLALPVAKLRLARAAVPNPAALPLTW